MDEVECEHRGPTQCFAHADVCCAAADWCLGQPFYDSMESNARRVKTMCCFDDVATTGRRHRPSFVVQTWLPSSTTFCYPRPEIAAEGFESSASSMDKLALSGLNAEQRHAVETTEGLASHMILMHVISCCGQVF